MPRKKKQQDKEILSPPLQFPNTGNEEIPPGATTKAADREIHPGGGRPGSGAGPRHGAADEGSVDEEYGGIDVNEPAAVGPLPDPTDDLEDEQEVIAGETPYAGISGGAVGGTPAGRRASGGRTGGGIAPGGAHRGDSTIGQNPDDNGETPPPKKRRPQKG